MEWHDEGILLALRRHGEAAAIIEVFTAAHGRHAGVVPGGSGRRMSPVLQPGNQISVTWRARLEDQIGTYRVEPVTSRAAAAMTDPDALAGLAALTALLAWALPEREAHAGLYDRSHALADAIAAGLPGWPALYARWELDLLADLGFGLDLGRCALTGAREGLALVSPRSGRAVTAEAGAPWAGQLLRLPAFLLDGAGTPPAPAPPQGPPQDPPQGPPQGDVSDALALSGHFLAAWLAPALERAALPPARVRLADRLQARRPPGA